MSSTVRPFPTSNAGWAWLGGYSTVCWYHLKGYDLTTNVSSAMTSSRPAHWMSIGHAVEHANDSIGRWVEAARRQSTCLGSLSPAGAARSAMDLAHAVPGVLPFLANRRLRVPSATLKPSRSRHVIGGFRDFGEVCFGLNQNPQTLPSSLSNHAVSSSCAPL